MDLKRFGLLCRDATEEDNGMVELSLGLSVGGSSRRALKSGLDPGRREAGTGSGEAADNLAGSGVFVPSSSWQALSRPSQQGDLADGLDPQRRREMHALRRQEARKKRHEKQQKKGSACGGRDGTAPAAPGFCGSSPPPEGACSLDDGAALECQEQRCRARDREVREEEARHSVRRAGENRDLGSDVAHNPELYPNGNANPNAPANPNPSSGPNFPSPNLPPFAAHPFPLMAMQYPFPPVQYVPMANGFGYPYMMPCWAPAMPSVAGVPNPATNVFQPVAYQAFQPFPLPDGEPGNEASLVGGDEADLSGGNGAGVQRARSWMGSSGSNSSAISDHQSNSLQGGSSSNSDIRSHSSSALVVGSHPQVSPQSSSLVLGQSEHSISSRQIDVEVGAVEAPFEKKQSSNSTQLDAKGDPNMTQCALTKLKGMVSVNKPVPAATDESIPPPLSSPLTQMPCVSTTGNGPNGKTITGFLYRYTSTEVSIVCVCHGSSFSPAEFVKHAGGTDVTNPLRHIVVVPS